MKLSVVVPTLNSRERLEASLDALDGVADECIVVNGPSSDGTTGMVRDRSDVDVLLELSERNPNVARNAGIEVSTGDVVAFVGDDLVVGDGWSDAVRAAFEAGADVTTGPTGGETYAGAERYKEPVRIAGRRVALFDGRNVAFDREVLEELDGFDEYLPTGGARDCAHRLARLEYDVTWQAAQAAAGTVGTDGGRQTDLGETYRSIAYRRAKNYGLRPSSLAKTVLGAVGDAATAARRVATGDATPTSWFGDGRSVIQAVARGTRDGIAARRSDPTPRRNPTGVSVRRDRAVLKYDWR